MKNFLICCLMLLACACAKAQSKNTSDTTMTLAIDLGLDIKETMCFVGNDRACLVNYYNTKEAPFTPFRKRTYHDSLSWAKMAVTFRNSAGSKLETDPALYFAFTRRAAMCFALAGNTRQHNYAIQNLGFMYQETLGKYDSALYFTNLALKHWETAKDTLNSANLYKYRAYLASFIDIPSGHADGHRAIRMFRSKKNEDGAMVSYRDLACLFIKEEQNDSANYYLQPAKEYWLTKKDTFRVFDINTQLMQANEKNAELVGKLMMENEFLRTASELPMAVLRVYYSTALVHARNIKDEKLIQKFGELSLAAQ